MNTIIVGISTSLCAGVIGWVLRQNYEKVLRPLGDKVLYKGPSIEDDWETKITFPDNSFQKIQLRLSRSGYRVTGKARCIEGYASGHDFEFRGEFSPPLLTGTYNALSPHSTERGAGAFFLSNNGTILRGQLIFSEDDEDVINPTECILKRAATRFNW